MAINLPWPEGRMSAREAAPYIGITEGTLAVWRSSKRYQIPYVKLGNKIFYWKGDLDEFLASKRVEVRAP